MSGWGPDYSVPAGDRNEPAAVSGPALARQSLRHAPAPPPVRFDQEVLDRARALGWRVFGIGPTWLFVRGGELLIAHIGPAGSTQYDLFAVLERVTVVRHAHWVQRHGLAPVEEALRQPDGEPPLGSPDGGRRGD